MRYNIIVGARPNFIKLWAFMNEAKNHPEHSFKIIHTGQHYDKNMSDVFFKDMHIPRPHITLENDHLGRMITSIQQCIGDDPVIVFGDTRTALAGALAAEGNGNNRIIHIEAGLRSFDNRMPEETNRIAIDHISHLLFTTEKSANDNLEDEKFDMSRVKYVGNLMIETLENFLPEITPTRKNNHIVVTLHRKENEEYIRNIISKLSKIESVIFVAHPKTKKMIYNIDHKMKIVEPMRYIDFMKLIYSSRGVITDSGGIQEETSFLRIPCATLRDNTERPETLNGSNKLFSPKDFDVIDIVSYLYTNKTQYNSDFKDNKVAERIFKYL